MNSVTGHSQNPDLSYFIQNNHKEQSDQGPALPGVEIMQVSVDMAIGWAHTDTHMVPAV